MITIALATGDPLRGHEEIGKILKKEMESGTDTVFNTADKLRLRGESLLMVNSGNVGFLYDAESLFQQSLTLSKNNGFYVCQMKVLLGLAKIYQLRSDMVALSQTLKEIVELKNLMVMKCSVSQDYPDVLKEAQEFVYFVTSVNM